MSDEPLLVPGRTCWQVATAQRFAPIIDGADYLAHVKAAMLRAERRIMLIGWDFDYRTAFEPTGATLSGPDHLGPFLQWLLLARRDLKVYLLKSNLNLLPALDGFWFGVTPVALLNQITSRRIHFAVDGAPDRCGAPSEDRGHRRLGGVLRWDRPDHRALGHPRARA